MNSASLVFVLPQERHHALFFIELQEEVAALHATIFANVLKELIVRNPTVFRFAWFRGLARREAPLLPQAEISTPIFVSSLCGLLVHRSNQRLGR
jgi:hypothetical protein